MRDDTIGSTVTQTATTAAVEILSPNPRRKGFMLSPVAAGAAGIISLSTRPNVAAGAGILNYVVNTSIPTFVDDSMLGNFIHMPWYIISANGGEVVQILEVFYVDDPCDV